MPTSLAIIGEYSAGFEPRAATNAAIRHSCDALGLNVDSSWVTSTEADESLLAASVSSRRPEMPHA